MSLYAYVTETPGHLALSAAFVAIFSFLTGCSNVGPSSRDLVYAGNQENAPFALIEITNQSIDRASSWRRPSLSALFGDYRPAASQRIQPGDSLQINIWETGSVGTIPLVSDGNAGSRVSFIPEQVVAASGTVTVPYAGRVRVADKTPQEIEDAVVRQLTGKFAQPQAVVTVTKNVSYTATVTGDDVSAGARVPLTPKGDRVLDVIAAAGGSKAPVHETFVTLTRGDHSLTVPLQTLLSSPRENIYVRPADVITVHRLPQTFTVVGATGRQALVPFNAGTVTLEEALAGGAGGLNGGVADPKGVYVLRYEPREVMEGYPDVPAHLLQRQVVPVAYHLDMSKPQSLFSARLFAMRDKDILYVSQAAIVEVEQVLRLFSTVVSPAVSGADIYYYAAH